MKKLIIIDVDDEKYTHAKVSLAYKDEEGYWADVNYETYPLRELPCKRETVVYWKRVGINIPRYYQTIGQGNIPTHEISEYDKGWNDCVDFLLEESAEREINQTLKEMCKEETKLTVGDLKKAWDI